MTSPRKSTPMSRHELLAIIKALGIRTLVDGLDDFLARAHKGRWSPEMVVEQLATLEIQERERRSLEWRLDACRVGNFKPIADFDWDWPREIDRPTIERLMTVDFVQRGENVVLVASQGLGKTMIAKNLVLFAVHKGYTALFVEAAQMLLDLSSQDSSRSLERRLKYYTKPKLLCIDEVGYLAYDQTAADLLFQVVSRRYEKKSIIVTTNLAFADWPSVFPGATSVVSLVDRLVHHAEVSTIEGESYRRREAERQKSARTLSRKKGSAA
jgi:DNA replication protein DnaC